MLSKTTRLYRREEGGGVTDPEEAVAYLETVRDRLEAIMEQLQQEKRNAEERWQQQRKTMSDELKERDAKIEKLETRVRQLQRENQQIRYQHGQRVSLMNILKQQNNLITNKFAKEKQRMRETIDLLLSHTHTNAPVLPQTPTQKLLPYKQPILAKPQQFYSMTDLTKVPGATVSPASRHQLHPRRQPREWEEEASLGRDLEASTGNFSEGEWEQSRVTRVRGRGQLLGVDRMSAVTQLSRQRTQH